MSRFSTLSRISAQWAAIGITGLMLGLSGCGSDGSDGATGPAGAPGPVGPPGPPVSNIIDYSDPGAVAALVAHGDRLVAHPRNGHSNVAAGRTGRRLALSGRQSGHSLA